MAKSYIVHNKEEIEEAFKEFDKEYERRSNGSVCLFAVITICIICVVVFTITGVVLALNM